MWKIRFSLETYLRETNNLVFKAMLGGLWFEISMHCGVVGNALIKFRQSPVRVENI